MTLRASMSGGYSLAETVVYIGLFVAISTILVGALFGMFRVYTELRVNDDLLDSAHVSMERMSREIRNAVSIDQASSTFGSNPGALTLNALDGSGLPKTVEFGVTSGALEMLDSTDGTARALTGQKVSVSSIVFRDVTTSVGEAVRVEITLESLRTPAHKAITLSDTVVLRGSY